MCCIFLNSVKTNHVSKLNTLVKYHCKNTTSHLQLTVKCKQASTVALESLLIYLSTSYDVKPVKKCIVHVDLHEDVIPNWNGGRALIATLMHKQGCDVVFISHIIMTVLQKII